MRFFFLTQTLIENFTHVGFHKSANNHTYRFYLLGSHSNVSLINPILTANALRRTTMVLYRILLRRYKSCIITSKLPAGLSGKKLFRRQQYAIDYWIPGTFSNRVFSTLFALRNKRYFLRRKRRRAPALVLLLGLSQKKTYDIYKEVRSRGLICVPLLDSDCDVTPYFYFIPTNTRSVITFYFFLDVFSCIFNYSKILAKKKFVKRVLKKAR